MTATRFFAAPDAQHQVTPIGAYVVAAWLLGIIVNLVSVGDYYDVALRDFGLLVGALALAMLAAPAPQAARRPR